MSQPLDILIVFSSLLFIFFDTRIKNRSVQKDLKDGDMYFEKKYQNKTYQDKYIYIFKNKEK